MLRYTNESGAVLNPTPRWVVWDIALTDYSLWGDAEGIVINVFSLYRESQAARR